LGIVYVIRCTRVYGYEIVRKLLFNEGLALKFQKKCKLSKQSIQSLEDRVLAYFELLQQHEGFNNDCGIVLPHYSVVSALHTPLHPCIS